MTVGGRAPGLFRAIFQANAHDRHPPTFRRLNDEYEASIELRKIYEVLDDSVAAKHDMVRIIDEEGEDYLYPADWFLAIELPHNVEEALAELTHS